ncbi:unnamed protein product, partial [Musa acuminata subsp. burmannicoides]
LQGKRIRRTKPRRKEVKAEGNVCNFCSRSLLATSRVASVPSIGMPKHFDSATSH